MGDLTRHFSKHEFTCKCGCGKSNISMWLVRTLDEIRNLMGEPIHINSGVRCEKHNDEVGGSPTSSHLKGYAVDIRIDSPRGRYIFLLAAIRRFNRIGIAKDFIHIDVDPDKPTGVVWLY